MTFDERQPGQQLAQALAKFLRYAEQALMLGMGALLVLEGEMTVGGMIAANVLMARALAPLDMVGSNWRSFLSAHAAYLRLRELLSADPEWHDGEIVPAGL